jgi:hypothetical protein
MKKAICLLLNLLLVVTNLMVWQSASAQARTTVNPLPVFSYSTEQMKHEGLWLLATLIVERRMAKEKMTPVFNTRSTMLPLVQEDDLCKMVGKMSKEILEELSKVEGALEMLGENINIVMGAEGKKLNQSLFKTMFKKTAAIIAEKLGARGLAIVASIGTGIGALWVVFQAIDAVFTLLEILNSMDITMENAMAEDLMADGMSEADARAKAEQISDAAMHLWQENGNIVTSNLAKAWHAYELWKEQRKCHDERHDKIQQLKPTVGADNREGNRSRMQPNDNFQRLGELQCVRWEYVPTGGYSEHIDENGNLVQDVKLKSVCVEYR